MAYVSPQVSAPGQAPALGQAPAPGPAPRSRPAHSGTPGKTLADVLWFPLLFLFGFCLCYLLPFHAPAPHGVKVAVAGSISAGEMSAGLQQKAFGAFDVIPVQTTGQARQLVLDQAAQGAFVVSGTNATLYTAGANGSRLDQTVILALTPIAHAEHLSLSTFDLVPTVPGDPSGTSLFYLGLAWNVVPLVLVLKMMSASLSRVAKLAVIVGGGAFAGIVVFLIGYGLGAIPGQSLAMLYAFLNFEAVALAAYGIMSFGGKYTIAPLPVLFVFLSVPSSGGSVPYQMVPPFFRWLHPIMPLGNLIDAMRSIFYFDGTNMTRPTLVLLAWIAAGAALITASALLERASQRQAPARASALAADRASRELPGRAPSVMQLPAVEAPVGHATSAGNGALGFGPRLPVLFGRVTDAAGGPVPGASITIIDEDGHQLVRTSTDRNGRYAVDGLFDGVLTVLLSPVGRMAVATRVVLGGDLPARQDFVLPDLMQGTSLGTAIFYGT